MTHRHLILLLAVALPACIGGKSSDDDDDDDDSAISVPETADSRVGCTETLEGDIGMDGSVDITRSQIWSDLDVEDGNARRVEYHYWHVDGDFLDNTEAYDANGCFLSGEYHGLSEGEVTDSRWTAACDAQGNRVLEEVEVEEGGGWVFSRRKTAAYSYDSDDRITELVEEEEVADGTLTWQRLSYAYDGDNLQRVDVSIDVDSDEIHYYYVVYEWSGDLPQEATIYLGAYFEDQEDDLYSTTTYAYDAEGNQTERANVPVDGDPVFEEWGYDALARQTYYAIDDVGGEEDHEVEAAWDPDYYRYVDYDVTDFLDGTQTATTSYAYDGGWPWSSTVERRYPAAPENDTDYVLIMDCPDAGGGGMSLARPRGQGAPQVTGLDLP